MLPSTLRAAPDGCQRISAIGVPEADVFLRFAQFRRCVLPNSSAAFCPVESDPWYAGHVAYLARSVDLELDDLLPDLPAIVLEGARGVGKTETALQRADRVFALDDPAHQAALAAMPGTLDVTGGVTLIDEWQRFPASWDMVRRSVDASPGGGRFLLTGSAMPPAEATAHSGAGRIVPVRMRPMSLNERRFEQPTVSLAELLRDPETTIQGGTSKNAESYAQATESSGFPAAQMMRPRARKAFLEGYIDLILDRDLPAMGSSIRRPAALRSWLAAYAAATSTSTSYTGILDAATPDDVDKPNRKTADHYRSLLSRLWLLDPLPGWAPQGTALKRVQVASKHHLADPGLALAVLETSAEDMLSGPRRDLLGPMFESLATLCIRTAAQAVGGKTYHFRERSGSREVDVIVTGSGGRVLAMEVKTARHCRDDDVRHLHWLGDVLGDRLVNKVVITTGSDAYRRPDGVAVIPLALLGP